MSARRTLPFALLCLTALLAPAGASAGLIRYEIGRSTVGNLSFSWLHTGTGRAMTIDGVDYYASGSLTHSISGELIGDYDAAAGKLTGLSGTLVAVPTGGGDSLSLALSGDLDVVGGFASGALDYSLAAADGTVLETGAFHFFPVNFGGSATRRANTFDAAAITLWGNNWDNTAGVPTDPSFIRRGMDLGGEGTPIPEPATVALLGLGSIAAAAASRRRRRSTSAASTASA